MSHNKWQSLCHTHLRMTLDPRLLRAFVVLAEELHFNRAAERLNIAQPGLSQQIRRLEQQAGSRLFTRSSRIVELTDSGRAMLEPARAAIRAIEQTERVVLEASHVSPQPLRIGIDFVVEDIVSAVAAYASRHSEMQLWLSRMYAAHGHEMLSAAVIDAFVGILAPPEGSPVSRTRAIDVPFFALVGPDHPIARRSAIPLSKYRESPIAMFARDHAPDQFDFYVDVISEGQGREALAIHEFRPTGMGSHSGMLAEISAGHAVGFGTPATLAASASHLRFLPFDPPLYTPTYVSWAPARSAVVETLVEHLSYAPD